MIDDVSSGQLVDTEPGPAPAAPVEPSPRPAECRIRRAVVRLLIAAVVGWSVFVLAHILLANRWWLWIVPENIPPFTLLVVPLLLLAAVGTRLGRGIRRPLLTLVLTTLLVSAPLAGVNLNAVLRQEGTPGASSVKIFSWNADYWDMEDDPATFIDYLRSKDADVYLLQEYLYWHGGNGADSGPVRIDKLSQLSAAFPGYRIEVDGELLTMSRVPIEATHPGIVSDGGDAWYWQGRKAQRIDLRVGGAVVSVYNVHLPQPLDLGRSPFTADFYRFLRYQDGRRQTQFDQLREDLKNNDNPVLLAGDFNSPWLGTLLPLRDDLEPREPAQGSVYPVSFAFTGSIPPFWRLDWVFTSDDVVVTDYRYVASDGLSDHRGQQFVMSLP